MLQKLNPQADQQDLGRTSVPVVIIGCGFGGMAMAIQLKKNGMNDFVILERASDIGGVWRDNSYPGAACDVVSRFYSFSFDRDRTWSQAFAPQDEIWQYQLEVVERFGIRPHVRFNTEVTNAAFNQATGLWTVETSDGHTITTPALISAVGLFNTANIPEIPGRDTFKGMSFHSSAWNHDYDLSGKTVGVVGNGASGVQFIPKIAAKVGTLNLFQRSPQYVMPKKIFPGAGEWDLWLQKQPGLRWLARFKIYLMFERFIWRRRWKPHLRLAGEAAFKKLLEDKVKDPELRRKLTPNYPMGCKRQLVSDVFYDAMVRPNVDVIDTPIERIVEDGIVTRDGTRRKLDAIIYGTGFKPTAYLTPMKIRGLGGRDLNEAWRDGAEAYLGVMVSGFPNFFMLYGPNTNAPSSIIFMLECQARYIASALKTLARKRARYMNVRADVQKEFNVQAQAQLATTVPARADCFTYFKIENGKITTNWPGYATEYKWRTRAVRPGDYEFVSP
jgi:cation diffusion facilitator CzcD-associated flavoprotein CzcO